MVLVGPFRCRALYSTVWMNAAHSPVHQLKDTRVSLALAMKSNASRTFLVQLFE